MPTKAGTVLVALAAITGIIIGFAYIREVANAFSGFASFLPFNIYTACRIYVLIFYLIDFIVVLGLLFMGRWARSLAIWWGVLAVLTIVMSIKSPSAMFIPNICNAVAAVCLIIAKADFAKTKK